MSFLTILRDTREQKGWDFENQPVEVREATLTTGDYTLAEFCDHDPINDSYEPHYCIERKSGNDFVSSVTNQRDRFEAEVKRASEWESPLLVLIECSRRTIKRNRDFMKFRDVAPSQLFGTVDSWERHYNVEFNFAGSRAKAQQIAFDVLSTRLRAQLLR